MRSLICFAYSLFLAAQEAPVPPPLLVAGAPNPEFGPQLVQRVASLQAEDRKDFFRLLRRQQREIQTRLQEMQSNRERTASLKQALDREGSNLAPQAQALGAEQERAMRALVGIEREIRKVRRLEDPARLDADPLQADFYAGFQFSSLYRDPNTSGGFFQKSKPFVVLDIRQNFRWVGAEQWMQFFSTLAFQSSSKEKSDTVDVITTSGAFRGEFGAWFMRPLTEEVSWGVVASVGVVGYSTGQEGQDLLKTSRDEFRNRSRLGFTLRQEQGPLRGSVAELAYMRDPQFIARNRLLVRGRVLLTQLGSQGSSGDLYMEGFVSKGREGRDEAVLLLGLRLSTLSFFRSLGWTGF